MEREAAASPLLVPVHVHGIQVPVWLPAPLVFSPSLPPGTARLQGNASLGGAHLVQRPSRNTQEKRCKVPGCSVILHDPLVAAATGEPPSNGRYSWRLRVCDTHRTAAAVRWPGQEPKRWCQVRQKLTPPGGLPAAPHTPRQKAYENLTPPSSHLLSFRNVFVLNQCPPSGYVVLFCFHRFLTRGRHRG